MVGGKTHRTKANITASTLIGWPHSGGMLMGTIPSFSLRQLDKRTSWRTCNSRTSWIWGDLRQHVPVLFQSSTGVFERPYVVVEKFQPYLQPQKQRIDTWFSFPCQKYSVGILWKNSICFFQWAKMLPCLSIWSCVFRRGSSRVEPQIGRPHPLLCCSWR